MNGEIGSWDGGRPMNTGAKLLLAGVKTDFVPFAQTDAVRVS